MSSGKAGQEQLPGSQETCLTQSFFARTGCVGRNGDIPRMTTLLGSQVRHQPSQSRNGPMLLFRGVRMRFFKYLALAILWVFPQSVAAAAKPQRIVSHNHCVDAVFMRIAEQGQIAAISQYSLDPQATYITIEQARKSVVEGKRGTVRVSLGGGRILKKKK